MIIDALQSQSFEVPRIGKRKRGLYAPIRTIEQALSETLDSRLAIRERLANV